MKLNGTDAILNILRAGGSEDIKGRAAKALHALTFQNSMQTKSFWFAED